MHCILSIDIRGSSPVALVGRLLLVVIPVILSLVVAPPHADVTAYPDTASLLGNHAAQGSAFRETWKLLGAVDTEGRGLHLQPVRDMSINTAILDMLRATIIAIHILVLLQLLVQSKAQAVFPFMTNRQVRENKVTSGRRAIKVCHASNGSSGEDGEASRIRLDASLGDGTRVLQSRKQEKVRIV